MKDYYPVFLDLAGSACLVAGAGEVGRRKVRGLLACSPGQVLLVDPGPADAAALAELLEDGAVTYKQRVFMPDDVVGKDLVFAATSTALVNEQIVALCKERGILCSCAHSPAKGSFIVPAVVRRESLVIALSTSGASPALARAVRRELEDCFGPSYGRYVCLLERIRPRVLALGWPVKENTALFRALTEPALRDAIQKQDGPASSAFLLRTLPYELRDDIEELLDGIC